MTAYALRISDLSSDVCSSDLLPSLSLPLSTSPLSLPPSLHLPSLSPSLSTSPLSPSLSSSVERRLGSECYSKCRTRRYQYTQNKNYKLIIRNTQYLLYTIKITTCQ